MTTPLNHQLDLVEQQFSQVAAFLAHGDAPQLETASTQLQALSVELVRLLQAAAQTSPAQRQSLRARAKELALGLQVLRDAVARQASFNQQSLRVLVPTPTKSTYGGGSSVYGTVAQQVGVHRYLAA